MGSNPYIFFKTYFHYCSSSVHYCEAHFHIHLNTSSNTKLKVVVSDFVSSIFLIGESTSWTSANWVSFVIRDGSRFAVYLVTTLFFRTHSMLLVNCICIFVWVIGRWPWGITRTNRFTQWSWITVLFSNFGVELVFYLF